MALRGLRDRAMPTLRPQRECSCVRGEESSKARRAFQTRARPMDRDEARPPRAARRRRARRARAPLRRQEDSRLAERLPRCPDRHSDACEPSRRCPRHGEGRLRRVTAPPPKGARPQPPPQAREWRVPHHQLLPPSVAPHGGRSKGGGMSRSCRASGVSPRDSRRKPCGREPQAGRQRSGILGVPVSGRSGRPRGLLPAAHPRAEPRGRFEACTSRAGSRPTARESARPHGHARTCGDRTSRGVRARAVSEPLPSVRKRSARERARTLQGDGRAAP